MTSIIGRDFLATLEVLARSSRTKLIGGAFSPAELAGDLLKDSGAVALASSLAAESIAANFVALYRLTSGFPRVGRHLVRGPAGASFAVGKGGHSAVFGSPRFGDRCGAGIAKRNTSQDVGRVTSVMIRVPGID